VETRSVPDRTVDYEISVHRDKSSDKQYAPRQMHKARASLAVNRLGPVGRSSDYTRSDES
jgi:hypothetical protein